MATGNPPVQLQRTVNKQLRYPGSMPVPILSLTGNRVNLSAPALGTPSAAVQLPFDSTGGPPILIEVRAIEGAIWIAYGIDNAVQASADEHSQLIAVGERQLVVPLQPSFTIQNPPAAPPPYTWVSVMSQSTSVVTVQIEAIE